MTRDLLPPAPKSRHPVVPPHRDRLRNGRYNRCFQNYYHLYQYLTTNPYYIPSVRPLVNHWQLRDLLKYDAPSNVVYYTKNDSINKLDMLLFVLSSHVNLHYYPRCYSHAPNGVVVTGGLLTNSSKLFLMNIDNLLLLALPQPAGTPRKISKGLFLFYNPELDVAKTVRLGEMINNDVAVYPDSNSSYRAYVCNNDSNLYCVDIPNNDGFRIVNRINCEINTCLNNVVRSPTNDKLLAVTGDSLSIFLLDPTALNPNVRTIKSGHESGFGIAYHPNGNLLSTVFQDGTCLLYDLRNISYNKPLIEIKLTRPGHQLGAFRVCKFLPAYDVNDMLIILEHVGRVHLVDLRHLDYSNVDDHQVMVVPYALDQYGEYKGGFDKYNAKMAAINADKEENENEDNQSSKNNDTNNDSENSSINSSKSIHKPVDIYCNSDSKLAQFSSFTSPLVFDYDYLTNTNDKLFKDFVYTPPPQPSPPLKDHYLLPPKFNYPQWDNPLISSSPCNNPVSPTSSQRNSIANTFGSSNNIGSNNDDELQQSDFDDTNPDIDAQLNYVYSTMSGGGTFASGSGSRGSASTARSSQPTLTDTYSHYTNYCDDSYQQQINHIHGEMELSGIEFCTPRLANESYILIGCQDAGVVMWGINGAARRSFGSYGYV